MKNYTYPIIDGVSIDIDELRLPLAVAATLPFNSLGTGYWKSYVDVMLMVMRYCY